MSGTETATRFPEEMRLTSQGSTVNLAAGPETGPLGEHHMSRFAIVGGVTAF